jgi:N6-adenosine-specific RNA methylase IME4
MMLERPRLDRPAAQAGQSLLKYDAARNAIDEAWRVDEVKGIRDRAVALQAYAKQAKDRLLIERATDIRLRAERKAGELLAQIKERGERDNGKGNRNAALKSQAATPKLADLGVTKSQCSQWQRLARLDEARFESVVADARDKVARATRDAMREVEIEQERDADRARTEGGCTVEDLHALIQAGRKFPTILADPPWSFRVFSGRGKPRSAERHYDVLSLDAIKALPVKQLAANDAALLLWAVWPELPGALDVIRSWGFDYKTAAFVWVKQNPSGNGLHFGMGYHTRSNSEPCLLATRGEPKRIAKDVHQIVMAPVGVHSAKPDEVQARIERLLPGPYLELYGRCTRPGWTVWGNEIQRDEVAQ